MKLGSDDVAETSRRRRMFETVWLNRCANPLKDQQSLYCADTTTAAGLASSLFGPPVIEQETVERARDQPSCSTQRQEKKKVSTEFDIVLVIPVATCPHVRQALVGLERGASCFSNPVVPDDEGLTLLPYTGDECLTYEGEINKLAVNVAFGR